MTSLFNRRLWMLLFFLLFMPKAIFAAQLVSDITKPVIVKQGSPVITLRLPANRTTGYQWYLSSYDASLIQPISYQYVAPSTQLMGMPGYAEFTIKLLANAFIVPSILHMEFIYQRPWELQPGRRQHITIIPEAADAITIKSLQKDLHL